MDYPKNYALLNENEMEYTTGGSLTTGVILLAGGIAGMVYSNILRNGQLKQVKADLMEKSPERYQPETFWKKWQLDMEAKFAFAFSLQGAGIELLRGVSSSCASAGFAETVVQLFFME